VKKIIIGLTVSETSFDHYPTWLQGNDESVEIIELSYKKNNLEDLEQCQAVVLSGGLDIMPENPNYENAPDSFNPSRDQFETEVLSHTIREKKPVLGICRGLQLINNYFGGDLILDLGDKNEFHKKEKHDKIHEVYLDQNSILYEITGQEKGFVNSAHHQAINKLAPNLKVSAASGDGVVEAIEYTEKSDHFLLAVQWHPERLKVPESPFSKNIREYFLKKIKKQNANH
jgi:putative glutamine amidotransferase